MLRVEELGRVLARGALCCLVLGLAACGGGASDGQRDSGGAQPVAVTLPETMTLPQYQAVRAAVPVAAASAVADSSTQAALVAANHQLVVAQLRADLAGVGNVAVLPPLAHAAVRSLAAAASGATLAEISSRFDLAPTPHVQAQQTGLVASQLWADQGRVFSSAFLTATDARGPWPRLAGWSAAETGFTAGTARSDARLTQALAAVDMGLGFDALPDVRLLLLNSLVLDASWPVATPFEGTFNRVRVPLLRISGGVQRQVGSDYSADLLAVGPLRLLQIRPAGGDLAGFAANRLQPVLAELASGLLMGQAAPVAPVAGELLLPQTTLSLVQNADGPLRRSGVVLAYDKVQANLRGLDAAGGTYAQSVSSAAQLRIAVDGLNLRAAHAMAFTFSAQNANGGGNQGGGVVGTQPDDCVWPTPDLRSFFLALLDAQGAVVALAAVNHLAGTAVEPTSCGLVVVLPSQP